MPFYFYYMYYLLHFYVSFMDVCAQTARYYLMPLLSLSYAFFLHTYPIEQYVPPIFGESGMVLEVFPPSGVMR